MTPSPHPERETSCPVDVLAGQLALDLDSIAAYDQLSLIDPAAVTAADIAASNTRRLLNDVRGERSNY